jgi:hypothetical protein
MTNPKKLNNAQIVTLAVAQLGGEAKAVDMEDIAVAAYKIAPSRFCWRKYPDRIDLGLIRDALRDAKKKKNGALLQGDNKGGWMISAYGLQRISLLSLEPSYDTEAFTRRNSTLAALHIERDRLMQSEACRKFQAGKAATISLTDFHRFVRINEYFPSHKRKERFTAIENVISEEENLKAVWSFLKSQFPNEFNPNDHQ